MKKLAVLFLVTVLIVLPAGCGVKEKIENKVSEKLTETIIEKAVGDENTKVDIDGDKITVKNEDGEELTIGGSEWPQVDYLPEFKAGNIISVVKDGEGYVMIVLEEVEKKDYENYLEDIKKEFTEDVNQMELDEYTLFEGKNGKGYLVVIQFSPKDKSLTIIGNNETE